jgi:hypothetical protein
MAEKIVLAGAPGDFGTRIARALSKRGADVVALGRIGTVDDKVKLTKLADNEIFRCRNNGASLKAESV